MTCLDLFHPFLQLLLVTALFILGTRFFGDRWLDRMDFGWTILAVYLARKFVGWNNWFGLLAEEYSDYKWRFRGWSDFCGFSSIFVSAVLG